MARRRPCKRGGEHSPGLAVPLRRDSQSKRAGSPGSAGHGIRVSPMSGAGASSKHTTRPGRGSSLNAHSNPHSTKRRLARYTVGGSTPSVSATTASQCPPGARPAESAPARPGAPGHRHRRPTPAIARAPRRWVPPCIVRSSAPPPGAVETVDHGTLTMSAPLRTHGSLHRAPRATSGIRPRLYEGQRAPSGRGRQAARFRGHRTGRPPEGARPCASRTPAPRRGACPKSRSARGPGDASCLALTGQIQSIKTTVQRY